MPYVIRLTELRDATNGAAEPLPEGGAYFAGFRDGAPSWTLNGAQAVKFDTGRGAQACYDRSRALRAYDVVITFAFL